MRGWTIVPIVFVAALLVALPVVALTETGFEKDLKEAVGVDTDACGPAPNFTSPWLEAEPLAEPRDEPRTVTVGDRTYLIGGTLGLEEIAKDTYRLDPSRQLTRFDPRSDRYEELTPLPQPLNHVGVAAHGGSIYVLGGYGVYVDRATQSSFYRFDLKSGRWTRLPDLPQPRAAMAVGFVGDTLIAAGGAVDSVPQSDAFAYDLRRGRWTRLPSMHSRRGHVGGAVAGGELYVLGGRTPGSTATDVAERFDPRTNSWQTLQPMPVPSGGLAAVSLGDAVLAISGGNDEAETVTGAVQELDLTSNEWRLLPELHTARHGHGVSVIDDEIWVFGGSDCAYFNATDKVEHIRVDELRGS